MLPLTRRRFLTLVSISGAAAATGAGLYTQGGTSRSPGERGRLQTHSRSGRALGSQTTFSVVHDDAAVASAAIDAAFEELERVEQALSIYRPESDLSRLNREGRIENPHPYLVEVLEAAVHASEISGGAFDVTVQPLWQLYSNAMKQGKLPEASEIASAMRFVDWRQIEISPRRISLARPGAAATLNGIAQGFAADRAAQVLREHGIEHALCNTGEIDAWGTREDGDPWTVGIQHPRIAEAWISMAELPGNSSPSRALATSGDYATRFTPDSREHHVFDPRTGRSPTELASVSVVAPTAMHADALSTAAMVLGVEQGQAMIAQVPDAAALFVLKSGRVLATEGFPFSRSESSNRLEART